MSSTITGIGIAQGQGGCLAILLDLPNRNFTIFAEAFHPSYDANLRKDLQAIAEPVSRPQWIHEYVVTPYSVGAAVSMGMTSESILNFLAANIKSICEEGQIFNVGRRRTVKELRADPTENQHRKPSKGKLKGKVAQIKFDKSDPDFFFERMAQFIENAVKSYGQASVQVGTGGNCWVDCVSKAVAIKLMTDPIVRSQLKVADEIEEVVQLEEEADPSGGADGEDDEVQEVVPSIGQGEPSSPSIEARRSVVYRLRLIDIPAAKYVAQRALSLGIPLQHQYLYQEDTQLPDIRFILRASTKPRDYQKAAVAAATATGKCSSGVIVLPCGAGKTLVGINIMAVVKKPTIIVCASSVSVEQWKNQIMEFGSFSAMGAGANGGPGDAASPTSGGASTALGRPAAKMLPPIACVTGKVKDPITEHTQVVITTYTMLSIAYRYVERLRMHSTTENEKGFTPTASSRGGGKASAANDEEETTPARVVQQKGNLSKHNMMSHTYGLMLLDEVHVVPAEFFKDAMATVQAKAVIGLTATFVREDHKIHHLYHLVGPKLFDTSWQELCAKGYLAQVTCFEVHCPMPAEFGVEYEQRERSALSGGAAAGERGEEGEGTTSGRSKLMQQRGQDLAFGHGVLCAIAAGNPMKFRCVLDLVERHRGSKILIFCDVIVLLHEYSRVLQVPVICGETPHKDRMKYFSDFQSTTHFNILCISRVGDVSVNLPSASVVIQVSSQGGSRRQEAQRLGRILRPKDRHADGSVVKAYFYSLVSYGTVETVFAERRSRFLINQGYTCRVSQYPFTPEDDLRLQEGDEELVVKTESSGGPKDSHGSGPGVRSALPPSAPLRVQETMELRWRVQWLAKLVSQWEFSLQPSDRQAVGVPSAGGTGGQKRRREDDESDDTDLTESDGDDDDILGGDHAADLPVGAASTIKEEEEGIPLPRLEPIAAGSLAIRTTTLAAFTSGEDGMVYHEF